VISGLAVLCKYCTQDKKEIINLKRFLDYKFEALSSQLDVVLYFFSFFLVMNSGINSTLVTEQHLK